MWTPELLQIVRKYHALVMTTFAFRRAEPICSGYGRQGHRPQGGYFQIRRSGSLDLTSSLEAKFGAKYLGSSVSTRHKSWEKVPILGSYLKFRGQNLGYLSLISLEAKFGAPTRISEANFGAKPPLPPDMEVPPWDIVETFLAVRPQRNIHRTIFINESSQ